MNMVRRSLIHKVDVWTSDELDSIVADNKMDSVVETNKQ